MLDKLSPLSSNLSGGCSPGICSIESLEIPRQTIRFLSPCMDTFFSRARVNQSKCIGRLLKKNGLFHTFWKKLGKIPLCGLFALKRLKWWPVWVAQTWLLIFRWHGTNSCENQENEHPAEMLNFPEEEKLSCAWAILVDPAGPEALGARVTHWEGQMIFHLL